MMIHPGGAMAPRRPPNPLLAALAMHMGGGAPRPMHPNPLALPQPRIGLPRPMQQIGMRKMPMR